QPLFQWKQATANVPGLFGTGQFARKSVLVNQYDEKKISTRKNFQIFFLILLTAVILLIFVPAVSQEIVIIMALPLTYLISNYLIFMKRKVWGNLFIYLFIALIIFMQLVH